MRLPYDAVVVETTVTELQGGHWFAGVMYKRLGDRKEHYAHRAFGEGAEGEDAARKWLAQKLDPLNREGVQ